ncbi:MAG: acetate kinase [Candidatus Acidiferrum sp.]
MKILVLNSGSSSQKIRLFEIGEALPEHPPASLWAGKIEWTDKGAEVSINTPGGSVHKEGVVAANRGAAIEHLLGRLWNGGQRAVESAASIDMVGHRVVHGGPRFEQPVMITAAVKSAIAKVSDFAPLHNRAELEGMEIVEKLLGAVRQAAVFDTGFHRQMPLPAIVYPGPYKWFEQGIHRYGFHGINHEYCARRAAQLLKKELQSLKLVSCHLGNGCSLAAIREGQSVDTTMGFTPLEGLMMGTRSGSVDPGILTYLMRQQNLSGEQLDGILNKQSGLLGVSGISEDMREIASAMKKGSERAKLAFDIYIHRLVSGIGAMVASLGGISALVFTAGVGENSAEVRAAACEKLAFLGLQLDAASNETLRSEKPARDQDIATEDSRVRVLMIRAQEEWAIARSCWLLKSS